MPYASTAELPAAAKKYADRCQRAFMHAFNSSYADHGDEGRAFATAHAAAQRCQEAHKSMPVTNAVEEIATPKSAQFKIFSGALTPYDGGDGRKRLRTIASSSIEDLSGDVITPEALHKMAESAKGMTIFRNHSYKVPQDILGSVEGAEVRRAGTDGMQKPIYDLVLDVVVMDSPENAQTYKAVESGVKLGTSIGAQIPPTGVRRGDNGGHIFDELRLLEASIVGIPQNPRSWVEYAASAVKLVEEEDEEPNTGFFTSTEPEVEKGTTWVEAKPDGAVKVVVETETAEPEAEKSLTIDAESGEVTEEVTLANLDTETITASVDMEIGIPEGDQAEADAFYAELDAAGQLDPNVSFAENPELLKAVLSSEARSNLKESDFACPEKRKYPIHDKAHIRNALSRCGDPGNDQCGCGKVRAAARAAGIGDSKDADVELLKSVDDEPEETSPDEPEAGTPAQEVGETVPESAEASEEEEDQSDTLTRSADVLADVVKSLTRERSTLIKRAVDAEAARDAAIGRAESAEANLAIAKEIVTRIANSPLGRKAVYREAVSDFTTRLSGIYSPEVLKMLETKNHD